MSHISVPFGVRSVGARSVGSWTLSDDVKCVYRLENIYKLLRTISEFGFFFQVFEFSGEKLG